MQSLSLGSKTTQVTLLTPEILFVQIVDQTTGVKEAYTIRLPKFINGTVVEPVVIGFEVTRPWLPVVQKDLLIFNETKDTDGRQTE